MIKRARKKRVRGALFLIAVLALLIGAAIFLHTTFSHKKVIDDLYNTAVPDYVDVQYIPNGISTSRNGLVLDDIKNIVIHYVGNPGTTAQQNHDYFANPGTTVNSHFLIGLDGEVIQCIPLYERSSASNWRNKDTISIEVCHPDETGKFNAETEQRLIELTAWLCKVCRIQSDDVIRHYDITGKECPLYYVKNESAWYDFLDEVKSEMEKY